MKIEQNKQSGFTLIELLIVLTIIGLLSSILVTTLATSRGKARDAKRKGDLSQIQKALELYYNQNNSYPVTSAWQGLPTAGGNCGAAAYTTSDSTGTAYIPGIAPTFTAVLPKDPGSGTAVCYGYMYRSNGTVYKLVANASAENAPTSTQPFYDVCRPSNSFMVSSDVSITNVLGNCSTW